MAVKIMTCPWCGKEARITYEENRLYQMKCYSCRNTMLHEDRSFDRAVEFFEHHTGLAQAEQDGRLVVLPFQQGKTLIDCSCPRKPQLMVNFRIAIAYDQSGIVFHQPFDIFMANIRDGYVVPVSKEVEAALEGGE